LGSNITLQASTVHSFSSSYARLAVGIIQLTHRNGTSLLLILSVTVLFVASLVVVGVRAQPTYTISASPTTINEDDGNVVITFTMAGGLPTTPYTFQFTVTNPLGSTSYCDVSFPTDPTGSYTEVLLYPNNIPNWVGNPATSLAGNYNVTVVETAPSSITTGFPNATFTVTNQLTVRLITPTQGMTIPRGGTTSFATTVYDVNGNPLTNAQVSVSTPSGQLLPLTATTPAGTYSGSYTVQESDPSGSWNITATAYTPPSGNFGVYSVTVNVNPSQLIVASLSTYNANGAPTADFSPGDTLYASFTVAYPTGGDLTAGAIAISVENPSGTIVATLSSIYDPTRELFYTPSGFQVSNSDPAGPWELVFPAQSLNDSYGNSGPTNTVTYRFVIHQQTQSVDSIYYIIAALALGGSLGTTLFFKSFNSTTGPFDDLFKLTGGEMPSPGSLMIVSDSGAGSTTMALQLLYRDLSRGKCCGLLSYDAFSSEIIKRMRGMGWDVAEYLKRGQFKILDCYSAVAGVESSLVKDPTDFTEVSLQVSDMIEKANGPVTIVLDSVTPILNLATPKACINFLQVIGAKIKNSGGEFIFTAAKGAMPEDVLSKLGAMADGVIELNLMKRSNSLGRTLQVKKMVGQRNSSVETGFEIVQGRGIVIRKQRLPVSLFRS
jgi:KaiC/GvpD/RAD55 family RecA-like ATPase